MQINNFLAIILNKNFEKQSHSYIFSVGILRVTAFKIEIIIMIMMKIRYALFDIPRQFHASSVHVALISAEANTDLFRQLLVYQPVKDLM